MRLYEFANAEEQLGLLRIIIDNTWSAVAQQAAQKKQADAEKKAKEKLKPRRKTRSAKAKPRLPQPINTANADPTAYNLEIGGLNFNTKLSPR